MTIVPSNLAPLLDGRRITLSIAVLSFVGAMVIGIQDVTAIGQGLDNRYAGGFAVFASIAAVYVVIALLSGAVDGWMEPGSRCSGEGPGMSGTTRVLFDEPGPRALRRIRIATVLTLLAIAAGLSVAIARFADAGQLSVEKWNVFTLPYVRSFLWNGLLNTLKLTVVSGLIALPLGVLFALLRLAHNTAPALVRYGERGGVPVRPVVVAGADVRPGAAAAGHQPADHGKSACPSGSPTGRRCGW